MYSSSTTTWWTYRALSRLRAAGTSSARRPRRGSPSPTMTSRHPNRRRAAAEASSRDRCSSWRASSWADDAETSEPRKRNQLPRGNKKPGARPGFSCSSPALPEGEGAKVFDDRALLQTLDAGRQRALVASGLVAVDHVLVDQRIHQRLRFLEGGHGIGLVAGGEGIVDLAQGGTHARTQRHVAVTVGLCSTGGFF